MDDVPVSRASRANQCARATLAAVLCACGGGDREPRPDPALVVLDPHGDAPGRVTDGVAREEVPPEVIAMAPEFTPAPPAVRRTVGWLPVPELDGEVATLAVPLDGVDPAAGTTEIVLSRLRAREEPLLGTLVINPGGPGALGALWLLAAVADDARRAFPGYDLVSFDPRGVGGSAGLECSVEIDSSAVYAEAGLEAVVQEFERAGQACESSVGPLFRRLGSHLVVRDMDHLREFLGLEKLNFLGISYGTRLGALYAQTFPATTGAVILDAPIGPVADLVELMKLQFDAVLQGQEAFYAACARGTTDCPDNPRLLFEQMTAAADAAGSSAQLSQVWRIFMADPNAHELLALVLRAFLEDPAQVVDPAGGAMDDAMSAMDSAEFVPLLDASANLTVNCTDNVAAPLSLDELDALRAELHARSPFFATSAWAPAACAGWPHTRSAVALGSATSAPSVLIIGGKHDSLTPFVLAEQTRAAVGRSLLVSSEHYGHSAFAAGAECAIAAMRTFLNGQLSADVACP
jgi:pimeloyl-ACP methyl ester carboxylesterase